MANLQPLVVASLNGTDILLEEFLHGLKLRGELGPMIAEAIRAKIIASAAKQRNISVSQLELQEAADDFRARSGLSTAADTHRWLAQHHLSVEEMESCLEDALLTQKLQEKVTQGQVEKHFAENRTHYDRAQLAHLIVAKEGVARELLSQIQDEGADFAEMAHNHSIDQESNQVGGVLGMVSRTDLNSAAESAVFGAMDGDVVGPIKTDRGYHLIKVEAIMPGQLNEETATSIGEELFESWLEQQAQEAGVQVKLYDNV